MNAAPGAWPAPSPLRLAVLLARLRWRLLWNAFRRPQVRTARFVAPFALVVTAAYVGLFTSALVVMGEVAGPPVQAAALTVVAGTIVFASFTAKVARGDAVIGVGGESEFMLVRPVGLPALVVAGSLAGVVTDLFDALFLLPLLIAAARAWDLPAWALPVAALTSCAAQVVVSASAQAAQILIVQHVPAAGRRVAWTLLQLLSVAAVVGLWPTSTRVLREPAAMAAALAALVEPIAWTPAHALVAPLLACRRGDPVAAVAALAALFAVAALVVTGAWLVARVSTRRGWEQAGVPWAEASRFPPAARRPLGLMGKDWRLMARDRRRLVALLAVPALFVGLQVFGSVGWSWIAGSPDRMARLAYSLAAYMAALAPLRHMEAERHAFWILRSVPQSMTRLLAWKALFWAGPVGGVAALVYGALVLVSGASGEDIFIRGAQAVLGAITVSFLAVAVGAAGADLSDERKPAVGAGAALGFMMVAALYNVVLVSSGGQGVRALLLYLLASAVVFVAGAARAEAAFDPDEARARRPSPVAGALIVVVVFCAGLGVGPAARAVGTPEAAMAGELVWAALLAVVAVVHLARARAVQGVRGRVIALLLGAGLGAAGGLAGRLAGSGTPWPALAPLALASLIARALVEELALRGLLQRGIAALPGGRVLPAAAVSVAAACLLAPPHTLAAGAAAVLPAVAVALTGRLSAALVTRGALVALLLLP